MFAAPAVFAGLLGFRQRRLAAGVGVVLGAAVSLVIATLFAYEDPGPAPFVRDASDTAVLNDYFSSLQQLCAQGVPDACAYEYGPAQEQLLLLYGYDQCRQQGNVATECVARLP